jgi:hypothetical protein
VGVVDSEALGGWVTIADPLTQMLARLPVEAWERSVAPPYDSFNRRRER